MHLWLGYKYPGTSVVQIQRVRQQKDVKFYSPCPISLACSSLAQEISQDLCPMIFHYVLKASENKALRTALDLLCIVTYHSYIVISVWPYLLVIQFLHSNLCMVILYFSSVANTYKPTLSSHHIESAHTCIHLSL